MTMPSWLCAAAEDRSDRACWLGSTLLFSCCALYISVAVQTGAGGGPPIRCVVPKEFPRSWVEHAETKCWEAPVLFEEGNRTNGPPFARGPSVKNYLRWLPAIFAAVAFAMALPGLFWRVAGHRAHELVTLSAACQWQPWAERSHVTAYVAAELRRPALFHGALALAYLATKVATCGFALACLRLLGLPFTPRHPLGPARLLLALSQDAHAGLMPSAYVCEYGNQLHGHQHTYRLTCAYTHEALMNCLCLIGAAWLLACAATSAAACLAWLIALLPPVRACLLARHRPPRGCCFSGGVCGAGGGAVSGSGVGVGVSGVRLSSSTSSLCAAASDPGRSLSCDSALLLMHIEAVASGLLARDVLQQLARLQAEAAYSHGCDLQHQQLEDPSLALLAKEQPSSFVIETDTGNHKGM